MNRQREFQKITGVFRLDEVENPIGLDRSDEFAKDDILTFNQLHIPTNTNVLLE